MSMIGYLGKKVDLICKDGEKISGYVFDVLDAEDSDIGCDCIEIAPLDREVIIVFACDDISKIEVDDNYKSFDFRR